MVYLEDLFYTPIVDADKGRDMATFDFPGVYLNTEIPKDKRILMNIRGYFVVIICQVNPEYEQGARDENGKIVCIYQYPGRFMVSLSLHCCGIISYLQQ